jgi:threonine aldolase
VKPAVDLRSDTATQPTEAMRKAMYEAKVGDDVLREDPTLNELESYAAELVGKEASLFVPSGTFGNQLSLFTHCQRGSEVVLSDQSHIVQHEAGAAAVIAGVQLRTLQPRGAYPVWEEIEPSLREGEDIHVPATSLVALENALSNGEVMPLEVLQRVGERCRERGVPVHLDGARLFNAAAWLGVDGREITAHVDSVMFCLSKGLCAPVGSLLAGDQEFIERARRKRKIMGGGMRQAGVLAAAGLVALRHMRDRLAEDRDKVELLAEALLETGRFEVKPWPPKINMIFARFSDPALAGRESAFVDALAASGVVTYPPDAGWIRFVAHHDVTAEGVDLAARGVTPAVDRIRASAGAPGS